MAASHSSRSRALSIRSPRGGRGADAAAAAAHDHFLRGWQHYFDGTAADNACAREAFEAAAVLEPHRSDYAVLAAWTHFTDYNFRWNGPPNASLLRAAEMARQLRERYPRDPWPKVLEAKLATWRGDWKRSLETFEAANAELADDAMTWANHADALLRTGRLAAAMQHVERAMELNPHDRGFLHFLAGKIEFATGNLDAALADFEAAVRRNKNYCAAYAGIAATQVELGLVDDAREAVSLACPGRDEPDLDSSLHVLGPYADRNQVLRWRNAWLKAGLRPRARR